MTKSSKNDLVNIISLSEASAICGLSPDHLRRLAEQGRLDARKIIQIIGTPIKIRLM